jgi:hypothetical protein
MSNDFVVTTQSAEVIDSFTAADGTVYEAVASGSGTAIVKKVTNEDGTVTETILNAEKGVRNRKGGKRVKSSTRKRKNAAKLQREFDRFKDTATAAAEATDITYDDSNLTPGGSGFLKKDRETMLDIVDSQGNVVGTLGGRIGSDEVEAAHAKTLAKEIININKSVTSLRDPVEEDDNILDDSSDDPVSGSVEDTIGSIDTTLPSVDDSVAGGGFEPTIPSTDVLELGPGEVAPIDPSMPQTVVQDVGPITYQDVPTSTGTPAGQVDPTTGTVGVTTQTGGLSAVPQQVTYKTHYAGTAGAVPQTLVTTAPGMGQQYTTGYQNVPYGNALGQRVMITEFNGVPTTYVPPGFRRLSEITQQAQATESAVNNQEGVQQTIDTTEITGAAEGGLMETMSLEGKDRIFRKMGYNGPKTRKGHEQFEAANPAAKAKGMAIGGYIQKFNVGGVVQNYQTGGQVQITPIEAPPQEITPTPMATPMEGLTPEQLAAMQASAVSQTMQPIQATTAMIEPTAGEFIPVDAGQTTPMAPFAEAATVDTVTQAEMPTKEDAATVTAETVSDEVKAETDKLEAAKGVVSDEAQVEAAQQETTSVSGLEAAQGTATKVNAPDAREIQEGELIDGVADATKAAAFTEQIQAAEATPSKQATVKGQLEDLMADFEGGETPAWAAGSMRTAMANLSARGLGASSLAGQAVIQAAMESALPIAMQDASTVAQFEAQNLSNRQQRAMLAAQQRATFLGMEFDQAFQARVQNASRIADVANMNFTAEQQIALEDARAANTMNLENLSNAQAMVLAEAAALSQLDLANLNNRQQAAVQNANSFLQMDMANLSNEQQTSMFKTQQNIQSMFTDQAAENAAAQFNATSENQTNQFFANLSSQTSQFNATQQNAMDQFNVNSVNALREFNSGLQQQRDLFNAQNGLVIAQSNAQWRQTVATINTATQNQSNMDFAKTINGLTAANMDQIWQRERDLMSFAFQLENNNADRATSIAIQELANLASSSSDAASRSASFANAIGSIVGAIITG